MKPKAPGPSLTKKAVHFAPWLVLGPVSGPLAAGLYRSWRAREFALASLYLIALVVWTFDLGLLTRHVVGAG